MYMQNVILEIFIMAFVKELVSEADKELYNSFQIYDYEHNEIHHWRSQKNG